MRSQFTRIAAIIGLIPSVALAHSDRRVVVADAAAAGNSVCTFPDGTHPPRDEIHCYAPAQFMEAYGIDQLHKAGVTGKGQTIILLDAFGSPTMQADLDSFSDAYKLPRATIHFIYPNGVYVNPLTMPDPKDSSKTVPDQDKIGWAGETTLDLEWAHAVAPDAQLVNVITDVTETEGMAGLPELFKGIQMAAAQYPNGIISMSFGTGEPDFTGEEMSDVLQGSFHQVLQNASQAGVTLLAATGDNGTAGENLDMTSMMDVPAAGYPASDPLVTAVGGTALEYGWKWEPQGTIGDYFDCKSRQIEERKTNPSAAPTACPNDFFKSSEIAEGRVESVWNEAWALAAGNGGVSTVFSLPDYQRNLPQDMIQQLGNHRGIPDISMNAAINGGVITYGSYQGAPWEATGGTSAATPEMAGIVALAGQRASELLGKTVGIGSLNPILYTLSADDFSDTVPEVFGEANQVVIDNNGLYFSDLALQIFGPTSETPVAVPGYAVTPGYDLATGLGTPIADRLVEDIAQARAAQNRLP